MEFGFRLHNAENAKRIPRSRPNSTQGYNATDCLLTLNNNEDDLVSSQSPKSNIRTETSENQMAIQRFKKLFSFETWPWRRKSPPKSRTNEAEAINNNNSILSLTKLSRSVILSEPEDRLNFYLAQELQMRTGCQEIVETWEANPRTLWNSYLRCRKNPGHINFIPISQFGLGHLPMQCRDPRLVSYIKSLGRFTVRVESRYTSKERPSLYPSRRGARDVMRLASGFAWIPGKVQGIPCPDSNCALNPQAHTVYGPIRILTNKHVTFDQSEAVKTTAKFFYDIPFQRQRLPTVSCFSLDYSSMDSDIAHLQCYTHDPSLCDLLLGDMDLLQKAYNKIPTDFWEQCDNLCVVISHPHGMAKAVSVGRHHHINPVKSFSFQHFYDSATCPGSSGAPVFYVSKREKCAHPMWIPAVHSQSSTVMNKNVGFK